MPYHHLLVPIESGRSDRRALEAALELALQHNARTTLMYVIEAIDEDEEDPEGQLQSFYADAERRVRERLQPLMESFQQAGLTVQPEIVVGHLTRTIVHYTATESVDLIVMASERADLRQPHAALRSVSHQVSLLSQCPVMLIK